MKTRVQKYKKYPRNERTGRQETDKQETSKEGTSGTLSCNGTLSASTLATA